MSDLRKAAQDLVDRWDTPLWKDAPHTGQYIDALRAALAQPERKPLTEDEISEIAMDCSFVSESDTYFARAIEKAHGIE
jgi:hypothetical protein